MRNIWAVGMLGLCSTAHGQTGDPARGSDTAAALALLDLEPSDARLTPPDAAEIRELADGDERDLSVYAGIDFVSKYVARGLVFADDVSVQPWIEADLTLLRRDAGPVTAVSLFAGNWNNITGSGPEDGRVRTGAVESVEHWYEADLYGGVRVTWWGRLQTSLRFNWYTSPADSFQEIREVDARITLDDSAFWEEMGLGGFAMTPGVRIAKETRDSGGPEQWYVAPRVSPSLELGWLPFDPTLTVPLAAGFGWDGQYVAADGEEHTFGFVQTGVHVGVPLDVLPEEAGSLRLGAGIDWIWLADDGLSGDGDRTETVLRFGVTYAF